MDKEAITRAHYKIDNNAMDDALRAQFNRMIRLGYKNIYYLETPKINDTDNEGTVDDSILLNNQPAKMLVWIRMALHSSQ